MALSDRSVFPNFFRTVPELLPPALATLMHYYGWKQLSIQARLTEEEPQFLKVSFNDSNIFLPAAHA